MEKKVVLNNRSGKLETLNADTQKSAGRITMAKQMMQIPDYEKGVKEKETPIETLVKKFERNGYTVE
jgi:hypothetical protein